MTNEAKTEPMRDGDTMLASEGGIVREYVKRGAQLIKTGRIQCPMCGRVFESASCTHGRV